MNSHCARVDVVAAKDDESASLCWSPLLCPASVSASASGANCFGEKPAIRRVFYADKHSDLHIYATDGTCFVLERSTVASCSQLFRELIAANLQNQNHVNRLLILHVNAASSVLESIFRCMFNSQLEFECEAKLVVPNLLFAFQFNLHTSLLRLIVRAFIDSLTVDNAIRRYVLVRHQLLLGQDSSSKSLIMLLHCETERFILIHFESFIDSGSAHSDITRLSRCDLQSLLHCDDLNVLSETTVVEALSLWLAANDELSVEDLSNLLAHVRFGFQPRLQSKFTPGVTQIIIKHVAEMDRLRDSVAPKDVSQCFKAFPTSLNFRPRIPHQLLLAISGWGEHGPLTVIEAFDVNVNKWYVLDTQLNDVTPRAYHGALCANGLLYVLGGFDGTEYFSSMRAFDPLTKQWLNMNSMSAKRCYVSAVELNGFIYALGGCDGPHRVETVERYDVATNMWSRCAPMLSRRSDAGACVLNGKIYVCGGFTGDEVLNTAEAYDPTVEQWITLPRMSAQRSGVTLVAFRDCVYAIGGFDGQHRLSSVERFNPLKSSWELVAPMRLTRSNFAASVLNDCIYVAGGYNGRATTNSVEFYDAESDSWIEAAPLNISRSALKCVTLVGLPNRREYTFHGQCASAEERESQSAEQEAPESRGTKLDALQGAQLTHSTLRGSGISSAAARGNLLHSARDSTQYRPALSSHVRLDNLEEEVEDEDAREAPNQDEEMLDALFD